jgi:4-amino-4-deoxy-L-arabinose transferase-like glycosyltransferase
MAEWRYVSGRGSRAPRIHWAGILPALAFLTFAVAALWVRPLLPVDETRYLAVAWTTYLNENHFALALNGAAYTHKTPLLFGMIEELWDLTGPSEKVARLVPILFGAATILLMRILAGVLSREDAPAVGRPHWVLVGLPVFVIYGQLLLFDAMLTCGALAAVIGIVLAARGRMRVGLALVLSGVAFGFASKGPVILLHTAPAALLASLWVRGGLPVSTAKWTGLMLAAIVGGVLLNALWVIPELVGLSKAYGWEMLWTQTFGRIEGQIGHPRPIWFFPALLPGLLFPWIASRTVWSKAGWRKALEAESVRLGLIWFGAAVVLHSLSAGKQPHYLLPSLPGAALVLAGLAEAGSDNARKRGETVGCAVLSLLVAGALLFAAFFPSVVARSAGFDVTVKALPALGILLCGLACWRIARAPDRWRLPAAAMLSLCVILLVQMSIPSIWARNDATRIAAAVPELRSAPVAWIGTYQGELTFAAQRAAPVQTLDRIDEATDWLRSHPNGVVLWRTRQQHIRIVGVQASVLPWRGRSLAVLRLRPVS